jgi:hypothetical protein
VEGKVQPSQAKFRLFSLISMLQKLKIIPKGRKGFIGDGSPDDRLWLLEVNLKVHRLVKDDE